MGLVVQLRTEEAQVPPSEVSEFFVIGWFSFMVLISTRLGSEFPPTGADLRTRRTEKKTETTQRISKVRARRGKRLHRVFRWEGKADWWRKCCRGSLLPGSLAGLVDLWFDVLDGGVFGDTRLGLLVSHLSSGRGEVLITLNRTKPVRLSSNRQEQTTSCSFFHDGLKSLDCPLAAGFSPNIFLFNLSHAW